MSNNRVPAAGLGMIAMFIGIGTLMAQTDGDQAAAETFVFLYEPGPNWVKDRTIYEQPLREHGAFMAQLLDDGVLVLAGPFSDNSGGMAIIEAPDIEHAREILSKDPGLVDGVFTARVRPWHVVFKREAP